MRASEATSKRTIQAIRPETLIREPIGRPGMLLGGKYRLDQRIASGGCASIWSALHVTLNRPVAVKFIETDTSTNREVRVSHFLREAKVAASVRHKNVVDILDFGASESDVSEPYMIMELLEGEALDLLLARTAMSTADAVGIIRQVLSGLDAVHAAGIVHRDMKPGNVFVSEDGDGLFARVLDFGISQELDAADDHTVVGTPEYMSPEQAYGESIDRRSDLYSVGVMLYEMLAGYVPFEDPDPLRVLQLVVREKPLSLSAARPDLPELCRVVETAMAHRPEDRFQCAREMQRALVEAMGVEPIGRYSSVTGELRESGKFLREAPTHDVPLLAPKAPVEPFVALAPMPDLGPIRLPLARRSVGIAIGFAAVAVLSGLALTWNVARPGSQPEPITETRAPIASVVPVAPAAAATVAIEPSETVPTAAMAIAPVVTRPIPRARTTSSRALVVRAAHPGQITRELDF